MNYYKLIIRDDNGIHIKYARDRRDEEEIVKEAKTYIATHFSSYISYELLPVSQYEYNKAPFLQKKGDFRR